jgi:hypothetical protein
MTPPDASRWGKLSDLAALYTWPSRLEVNAALVEIEQAREELAAREAEPPADSEDEHKA